MRMNDRRNANFPVKLAAMSATNLYNVGSNMGLHILNVLCKTERPSTFVGYFCVIFSFCNCSQLVPYGFVHCNVMLGSTPFIYTFIVCNTLQKEYNIGLNMQQLQHIVATGQKVLICYLISSIHTIIDELIYEY